MKKGKRRVKLQNKGEYSGTTGGVDSLETR